MIYSFCNKNVKERMRDHIKRALDTFNVNSRIVKYGNSLEPKFFEKLEIAIIFHDFGKIIIRSVRDGNCTFPGHEIVSGWGVYRYMTLRGYKDIDRYQVTLGIMLHHHPMDIEKRVKIVRNNFGQKQVTQNNFNDFFNEIEGVIDNNVELPREQVIKAGEKVTEVINQSIQIFNEGWKKIWMSSGKKEKKVFLLLLQGLVASDYNSAKERGSATGFNKVIEDFVNLNNGF
ncbi:hypothetical protein [Candidatus Acidianus copahuensis]|nr:hypothetical protein [Candidatus Acidianus copahuensis]